MDFGGGDGGGVEVEEYDVGCECRNYKDTYCNLMIRSVCIIK